MSNDELADRIEKLDQKFDALRNDFTNLRVENAKDISTLMVKSRVWNLIGGALPVAILLGVYVLKSI